MALCRVGWHRWTPAGSRVACRWCRVEAAVRPPRVVAVWWLLVLALALTVALAVTAFSARPGFQRFAPSVEALGPIGRAEVDEIAVLLGYDAFGGIALAVILGAVLVGMRGLRAWSRWAAILLLPLFMLGRVMFMSSDPTGRAAADRLLPTWYPAVQHALELPLFLTALAVVVLLLHESSRTWFEEGLSHQDVRDFGAAPRVRLR
jgi:hypothetical protein